MGEGEVSEGEAGEVALDVVRLARPDDAEGWRRAARVRLAAGIPPERVVWAAGVPTEDLFAAPGASGAEPVPEASGPGEGGARVPRVPRAFLDLAERVACHRDPDRFALLYRVLWRCSHGDRGLLTRASDPDMHRLQRLGSAVSRERHKMHAFVRFRRTPGVEPEHFGAWFEPEHHTLRLSSGFFVRRFATMCWSIVTPEESAHWDTRTLVLGAGGTRGEGPGSEAMEALWRTYFANVFDPARLRLDAMRAEMPVKYWKNLPEASLIAELVHRAGPRAGSMLAAAPSVPPRFAARATHPPAHPPGHPSAHPPAHPPAHLSAHPSARPVEAANASAGDPETFPDLAALRARTARCARCEHACRATRAVDGDGPPGAALMLVGEQPGDREDLVGRPFAGPAGTLLRALLAELDVPAERVFLTNAVRHFHHEPRGTRRLHRTPTADHVDRCRPFLFEEIRLVAPRVVVALGATAARALLGHTVRVGDVRGRPIAFGEGMTLVPSAHPASILRTPDEAARVAGRAALRADLALALDVLARTGATLAR